MDKNGSMRLARIYQRSVEGDLIDDRETYDLDDFGGTVPRVGELIISPWLKNTVGEKRSWDDREVYVVEAVYYRPDKRRDKDSDAWVILVVRPRLMEEHEEALL